MRKIYTLADDVVARIAAGEVIERPVYAVKELVENALDAHADTITVQIEEGGLKKIVVTDDGEGMSERDVQEAWKPHTTSKIRDNLFRIETLGFRGEALSSIAAVSTFTLQSRTKNNPSGYQVVIKEGKLLDSGSVGMPPGTHVTVQNLFQNVPARKKFLKTPQTEFRHIVDLLTSYGLAHPERRFLLLNNARKKPVIDLVKNQTLESRVKILLGGTYFSQLLPVKWNDSYLSISGFIARPQVATRLPSKQYLFVNKRWIQDRLIAGAVKDAYGTVIASNQFPVFALFVDAPFESVDVNVHPRKEQVNFVNKQMVLDAVKEAVRKSLNDHNLIFSDISYAPFSSRRGSTNSFAADVLRESVTPWNIKDVGKILDTTNVQQIHDTYLMVQTKNGIVLVDQHAAHERILYEQFQQALKKEIADNKKFILPKPYIVELSASDIERMKEFEEPLLKLGFEVEYFMHNAYRVNAVPEIVKDLDIATLVIDLLSEIEEGKGGMIEQAFTAMISFLACRSAVMAGEKLTVDEAEKLIQELEQTPQNATCPHGRPTKMEISVSQLHKMFKRE